MHIERVTVADAAELLEIYGYYTENTAISFEYVTPSLEEFQQRIRTISEKYPYIKAVEDGRILGYAYAATFKGRRAYDWSVETTIYLRPECRRRGIGAALYDCLEAALRRIGVLNMNACIALPIGEDPYVNRDSFDFHSRMGFTTVGVFHYSGSKFGHWYDMIWMEKMLGEHENDPKEVDFGAWRID